MDKGKRILIIQGHPDALGPHFCHALAQAYKDGAEQAGHTVRVVDVAALDFPLLRTQADWEHGQVPASLLPAQQDIAWCEHMVLVFPLWLGDMPALLKGFLEQVARPGFAFTRDGSNPFGKKGLSGRSARSLGEAHRALRCRVALCAVRHPDVLDLAGVTQELLAAPLTRLAPVAAPAAADPGALEVAARALLDIGATGRIAVVAP